MKIVIGVPSSEKKRDALFSTPFKNQHPTTVWLYAVSLDRLQRSQRHMQWLSAGIVRYYLLIFLRFNLSIICANKLSD
jgi:hypothetical protein